MKTLALVTTVTALAIGASPVLADGISQPAKPVHAAPHRRAGPTVSPSQGTVFTGPHYVETQPVTYTAPSRNAATPDDSMRPREEWFSNEGFNFTGSKMSYKSRF